VDLIFNNARDLIEKEMEKVYANPYEYPKYHIDHLHGQLAELGDLEAEYNEGKLVKYDH